jgi:hypothetical protein
MARLNRLLGAVELLSRHLGGAGDEVAEIRRSLGRFAAVDVAAPEEYPVRPDMLILFVEEELARLLERMDLIMPGEMDSPMDADRIRTRRRHAVGLIVATLNAVDRLRQI